MEAALPVITLISLALAIYFWSTARRVQRREQERSDARVAALSEAAGRPASTPEGWAQVDGEWHWESRAETIAPVKPVAVHRDPQPTSSEHFFGTVEREGSSGSRLPLVAAAAEQAVNEGGPVARPVVPTVAASMAE